jgi:hypothetical protein
MKSSSAIIITALVSAAIAVAATLLLHPTGVAPAPGPIGPGPAPSTSSAVQKPFEEPPGGGNGIAYKQCTTKFDCGSLSGAAVPLSSSCVSTPQFCEAEKVCKAYLLTSVPAGTALPQCASTSQTTTCVKGDGNPGVQHCNATCGWDSCS